MAPLCGYGWGGEAVLVLIDCSTECHCWVHTASQPTHPTPPPPPAPQVHTLFPSPKTEEGIKGGVVLLRLRPPANGANTPLRLAVTYSDREGKQFRCCSSATCPAPAVWAHGGWRASFHEWTACQPLPMQD